MIWIVENVEAGRHRVVGVTTDRADVLRLESVGIELICSVDRFAHGDIGGREVDHSGHAAVRLGVEPASVSLGGSRCETSPDRDVLWCLLEDGCRPTFGERPGQLDEVVDTGVSEIRERLVARLPEGFVDALGDDADDGEVGRVHRGPEGRDDDVGFGTVGSDAGDRRRSTGTPFERVNPGVSTLVDEVSGGLFTDVDVVAHSKGDSFERDLATLTSEESSYEVAQDGLFVGLAVRVVARCG